jgi:CRP-like cAMP-binding protein
MSAPSIRTARTNRILAALPRDSLDRLMGDLDQKALSVREVLQARDVAIEHVVFPTSGVASMISMGNSGASIEVATIGCEGMVGLPLFLGGQSASGEVFIQVPGEGLLMTRARFQHHIGGDAALMQILLLYVQALLTQVAQCSACNVHHSISQRCARWLLQTHDRVAGDQFPLTQEFLSLMLGVRRATVTVTAQALQSRGLISYHRGIISVLDRSGLEKASCECYGLINREYKRLLKSRRGR